MAGNQGAACCMKDVGADAGGETETPLGASIEFTSCARESDSSAYLEKLFPPSS